MRRTLWMLGLLTGLAACSSRQNNTKIVVVVWSDLTVPTDMDNVRIDVKGPTASPFATFPLTTSNEKGKTRLPVVLALVPPDNNDLPFDVAATACKGTTPIVSQQARLSFLSGQSRVLTLFLGRACLGKICTGNKTCSSGSCEQTIDVDASSLPAYDPKAALSPPDGGAGPSLNAGVDAGEADGGGAETGGVDAAADGTGDRAVDKPAEVPGFAPDSRGGDGGEDTGTGGTSGSGEAGGSGGSGDARVPDAPSAEADVPIGGTGGRAGAGGSGGGYSVTGGTTSAAGTTGSGGTTSAAGTTGSGGTTSAAGTTGSGGTTSTGGTSTGGTSTGAGGTGGTTAVCQGSATRCSGSSVQTCTNGQWGEAVACGGRQTCAGPVGTAKCTCNTDPVCGSLGDTCANPSTLATCSQDAQACFYQSSAMTCANGACSGSAGAASCCTNTCTTGATCLSSTSIRTCAVAANGCTTTTTSTCSNGVCSGPAGAASCCTNACTPGATQCLSSTSLQTCAGAANGCTAYSTTSTCSGGLVCERYASAACVDPNWAEWPMPNSQADVTAGAPNLENYTDNKDGTVTDNVTGLMWQQAVPATRYTWASAVALCPTLTLAGHSDWRLPSRIELVSIVDVEQSNPTISGKYFPSTPAYSFWSSSPDAGLSSNAWLVAFFVGNTNSYDVSNTSYVRCVR